MSLTDLTRRLRPLLPALGVLPGLPCLTLPHTFPEACRVLGGGVGVLGSEGPASSPPELSVPPPSFPTSHSSPTYTLPTFSSQP